MVTNVENKVIKVTIIVYFTIIVYCLLPFALETRWKHTFSQYGLKLLFFIFLFVDCASFMCDLDKPRSTKTQRI